jgi:hypothetical protein
MRNWQPADGIAAMRGRDRQSLTDSMDDGWLVGFGPSSFEEEEKKSIDCLLVQRMAELIRHATSLFLKGKGSVGITEARVRNSTRNGKESEQGVRDCGCLGFPGASMEHAW